MLLGASARRKVRRSRCREASSPALHRSPCARWGKAARRLNRSASRSTAERVKMKTPHPTAAQLAAAIALASRAPSVHNTQPWQWRITPRALELFADPTRGLQVANRHARLLMLSCGATLHHVAVAIGAAGWRAEIARFPNPAQPTNLASITFAPQPGDATLRELAQAIS